MSYEYGGDWGKKAISAKEQIKNGVAADFPLDELLSYGITKNDIITDSSPGAMRVRQVRSLYL